MTTTMHEGYMQWVQSKPLSRDHLVGHLEYDHGISPRYIRDRERVNADLRTWHRRLHHAHDEAPDLMIGG